MRQETRLPEILAIVINLLFVSRCKVSISLCAMSTQADINDFIYLVNVS